MDSILVTTTTTMRITFVNLPAILLALAIGAVALPTIIDREGSASAEPVPSIIDRDSSNKNSYGGGGSSHFSLSPVFCSTRR